jgi:hypothetical protein
MDRQRSHVWIINTGDKRADRRELLKMLKCPSHFLRKSVSYVSAAFTVPRGSFA